MKHIILIKKLYNDGYAEVCLDGKALEQPSGYPIGYCEHPVEVAEAIEYALHEIKGEPFEFQFIEEEYSDCGYDEEDIDE